MTLQLIYVDDAAIGATGNTGITTDGTTITSTKAISGTALTLSGTLTGGTATDIALNTDKFTVDGTNGNTLVAGTFEATGASTLTGDVAVTGALAVSGGTVLGGTEVGATSGAYDIDENEFYTGLTTNATANITIALGDLTATEVGQMKMVKLSVKDTSDVVITPATFLDGATITLDASLEVVMFVWTGTSKGWSLISNTGTLA